MQAPFWHASPSVHGLASLHVTPFCLGGFEQMPVALLHTPTSWHWSAAVQLTCAAPTQAPAWQVSVAVQALPSLQLLFFGFSGLEQAPVSLSQVPGK